LVPLKNGRSKSLQRRAQIKHNEASSLANDGDALAYSAHIRQIRNRFEARIAPLSGFRNGE